MGRKNLREKEREREREREGEEFVCLVLYFDAISTNLLICNIIICLNVFLPHIFLHQNYFLYFLHFDKNKVDNETNSSEICCGRGRREGEEKRGRKWRQLKKRKRKKEGKKNTNYDTHTISTTSIPVCDACIGKDLNDPSAICIFTVAPNSPPSIGEIILLVNN